MKKPGRKVDWWQLKREEQAILAQFRVGPCPLGAYFERYRDHCDHAAATADWTIIHLA